MNIKRSSLFVALVFQLFFYLFPRLVLAQTVYPPSFATCQSLYGTPGDVASYEFGTHQILGDGLLEGSDNVYSQVGGNYIQCYCPVEGVSGIQTNWWLADGLNQSDIEYYISKGWFYENGLVWNLGDHMYLAKNSESVCANPTPTLIPTPTPTRGLTPPSAPVCNSPSVSLAPLYSAGNLTRIDDDSIKITWIVTDGHSQKYGIHYGTSPDNLLWYTEVYGHDTTEVVINFVPKGNIYFKVCSIGDCGDAVCGNSVPAVLGATSKLPSTGSVLFLIVGLLPLGYYLYKRFRLV